MLHDVSVFALYIQLKYKSHGGTNDVQIFLVLTKYLGTINNIYYII